MTVFPPAETRRHLQRATARGWLPLFEAAARARGLRVEVLLAIASRESHIGGQPPLSASWTGDGGHGRGIMQIDDRWHGPFLSAHRNDDHAAHIDYAAGLLAQNLSSFRGDERAAIAAYNAGSTGVRRAIQAGRNPDSATTGGNYSQDVLARAETIRAALSLPASGASRDARGLSFSGLSMFLTAGAVLLDPTAGALTGLTLALLSRAESS